MDLTGRCILVTGASSGIGRATARLLSQLGARVILAARHRGRLEETAAALEGTGHRIEPYDLHQVESLPEWIGRIAAEVGPLSGLVHSAGVQDTMPLRYLRLEKWNAMMQVNLTAALMLAKGFRRKGVCVPRGSIVFVSSILGLRGAEGESAYAATKGALIAAVRALALDLAAERIRINCVAPGHVEDTGIALRMAERLPDSVPEIRASHPLGLGKPIHVAHAIAFLLADTASWISGTTLVVDGACSAG
jgi:NAD(P)-dependent dehydrogenase (short-subunit alcohol dehydrogenase family)